MIFVVLCNLYGVFLFFINGFPRRVRTLITFDYNSKITLDHLRSSKEIEDISDCPIIRHLNLNVCMYSNISRDDASHLNRIYYTRIFVQNRLHEFGKKIVTDIFHCLRYLDQSTRLTITGPRKIEIKTKISSIPVLGL